MKKLNKSHLKNFPPHLIVTVMIVKVSQAAKAIQKLI